VTWYSILPLILPLSDRTWRIPSFNVNANTAYFYVCPTLYIPPYKKEKSLQCNRVSLHFNSHVRAVMWHTWAFLLENFPTRTERQKEEKRIKNFMFAFHVWRVLFRILMRDDNALFALCWHNQLTWAILVVARYSILYLSHSLILSIRIFHEQIYLIDRSGCLTRLSFITLQSLLPAPLFPGPIIFCASAGAEIKSFTIQIVLCPQGTVNWILNHWLLFAANSITLCRCLYWLTVLYC
jgi:hypothetical protein